MKETPKIENSGDKMESKESKIRFFREASRQLGFIENEELEALHRKIIGTSGSREAFIEWADKAQSLEIFNEEDPEIYGKAQLGLNIMQISMYMELGTEKDNVVDIEDIADQAYMLGEKELAKKIESILK